MKTNVIAIVSLVISIVSIAFGVYQWRQAEVESRKTAAIEYTLKSIGDPAIQSDRAAFMRAVLRHSSRNDDIFDPKSDEYRDNTLAVRHLQRVDYLALLINSGRFDIGYISTPLICEVLVSQLLISHKKPAWLQPYVKELKDIPNVDMSKSNFRLAGQCDPTP